MWWVKGWGEGSGVGVKRWGTSEERVKGMFGGGGGRKGGGGGKWGERGGGSGVG